MVFHCCTPASAHAFFASDILCNLCGFAQVKEDQAVYIKTEGDKYTLICTWVDDFIVFGNCSTMYEELVTKYFSEVDGEEGPLDFALGVNFDVDLDQQTIKIYSEKSIADVAVCCLARAIAEL